MAVTHNADAACAPVAVAAPHTRLRGQSHRKAIPLSLFAAIAILVCAAPAATVLVFALSPAADSVALSGALLREATIGTAALVFAGGGGALVLGAAAAWLTTLCDFAGRRAFEWLLVLPLAAPSYILAYAYSSLTWAGGPIQLPVTGAPGAAFIYAIGLYPYVYLAVRAGLASQSAVALEAARTLGAKPRDLWRRVALPLARPSLVAGGALACMEIAADYGAAQHFGVTTLSTAIFRAWYSHGSTHGALQIAAVLLLAALAFLLLERHARGRASFSTQRWTRLRKFALSPAASIGAFAFCAALVLLGAGLPLAWLARLALTHASVEDLARPFVNTLTLATGGALITLALGATIAATARRSSGLMRLAPLAANLGYAAPGAVISLGALALFGAAREAGLVGGFGATLAIAALVWAYAARFAAAGAQPIEAGLARAPKNVDAAAALLGAGPWRRLLKIDLPIASPSLAAGALILFVEIIKELPATLILRPFDFDTLAVKAYAYASDERLLEAAAPALLIFVAGLAPMLVLARSVGRR